MPRGVSMQRQRCDARKYLYGARERTHHVVIRCHLLAGTLEVEFLCPFAGFGHCNVVVPVAWLVFVHDEFGIGEQLPAGLRIRQTGRVIGVHMGEQHLLDCCRIDSRGSEVLLQFAGGRKQIVPRACFDKREPAGREDRITVHRSASARTKVVVQDRIASPEMLPSIKLLPHLICSRRAAQRRGSRWGNQHDSA